MLRWIVLLVIVLVVFESLRPWLARIGLRHLPGDFNFRWRGRDHALPLGSAVLISVIGWAVGHML